MSEERRKSSVDDGFVEEESSRNDESQDDIDDCYGPVMYHLPAYIRPMHAMCSGVSDHQEHALRQCIEEGSKREAASAL